MSACAAWLLPWPWLLLLLPFALPPALAAALLLSDGWKIIRAYTLFSLFWLATFFLFRLGAESGAYTACLETLEFGTRLSCLPGAALAPALRLSALELSRIFVWYLSPFSLAWRCGLALAVMLAFLPRCLRVLRGLRVSAALRAPHLSARRRIFLLGLASLRILGAQTWSMAICIAGRDLYRPGPWLWRAVEKKARRGN